MKDDIDSGLPNQVHTVDAADEGGLQLWSLVLGVSVEAVRDAARVAGPDAEAVQREIVAHPERYRR
ncbi:hypothetical protein VI08_15260 [Luteibacter yeojuensis]|uniref:DUF3606 domain-containing protein n=1 Tax=Luteibacter yeojuensis TaxID=345309 RepID=A0A0F3KG82_9GAMM|nr:hypothetical protein VI08_15260 [Luteibacter yeojuensis]